MSRSQKATAVMSINETDVSSTPSLGDGDKIQSEELVTSSSESTKLFSAFTRGQKLWISIATSIAALFSPLSGYIYYPALVSLSKDLGVSLSLMNLTVTSYLIVAGIAPAFMGDLADHSGRRPVYMLMFCLMIGANIGMALQNSFPSLLVLRMIQSAGSSGLLGAAYGVVADIAEVNERGSYVGILLGMTDIALSLGPVLGGVIDQQLGWRWIFWFLVILTTTHFIVMILFVPETQRRIVGDGSARVRGIYWSLFAVFRSRESQRNANEYTKIKFIIPNPLTSIKVLQNKSSLSVILLTAVNYTVKMTLQTSVGAQCIDIYGLNDLQGGLVYLASGAGSGLGSFITGKYVDRTYRKTVDRLEREGLVVRRDSPEFPLEAARLRGVYVMTAVTTLGTVGYGWVLMTRTNISAMLVMQFLTGLSTASAFVMFGTLLTDLNIHNSATAQAASNLVRCLSAGGAIAVLQPLIDATSIVWCFAIFAFLTITQIPLVIIVKRFGGRWRKNSQERNAASVVV